MVRFSVRISLLALACLLSVEVAMTRRVQMKHACENAGLSIRCPPRYVIQVLYGFYGRTSDRYCARGPRKTYRCRSSRANGMIKSKCNNRRSCSVHSSNSVFGDPCVGTYKYTIVRYRCRLARSVVSYCARLGTPLVKGHIRRLKTLLLNQKKRVARLRLMWKRARRDARRCKRRATTPKTKSNYLKDFHRVFGWDCVQTPYVRKFTSIRSRKLCAAACHSIRNCQAFTVMGGPCRLFVFSKCSKNVRKCSCERATLLYVRRQKGLRPGALCPADFLHNRCGVVYKFTRPASGRWNDASKSCRAERGLSIMAEPIDLARYRYLVSVYNQYFRRQGDVGGYYLGGRQDPGSPEPIGGWFWQSCRKPIHKSLWAAGQPDNGGSTEHFACTLTKGHKILGLNDCQPNERNGAFCECVSPFDMSSG